MMTNISSVIGAIHERAGLNPFATNPMVSRAREQTKIEISQTLLLAHPLALDRGSALIDSIASAIRTGSSMIDAKKSPMRAIVPMSIASHGPRFGVTRGSGLM